MLSTTVAGLLGQQPYSPPAPAAGNAAIYQTYQQQLRENQRRLSGDQVAYQQQLQRNHAAQTYLPPVHIAPPLPSARDSRRNESLNGRFNPVQNYAAKTKPAYAHLSDNRQHHHRQPVRKAGPQPSPASLATAGQPHRSSTAPAATPAPKLNGHSEHIFLQDRIASALSRHLGRSPGDATKHLAQPSTSPSVQVDFPSALPSGNLPFGGGTAPEASRAFEVPGQEQYAARLKTEAKMRHRRSRGADKVQYDDSDYEVELDDSGTDETELAHSVWERTVQESENQERDDQTQGKVVGPIASADQDQSRVVPSSFELRRSRRNAATPTDPLAPSARVAKRSRRMKTARPIAYRPTQSRLRASEVSILVGQEREDSLEDPMYDLPLDGDDQRSLSDDAFSSPLRPKPDRDRESGLGGDLDSVDDRDANDDDRVRSRLNEDFDELDDMGDLDDIDDADLDGFDDDESDINRPTVRPCNEFRDELLSTSIRDISLDISPPAFSETSVYGGPSRSWTDRSGNAIAAGTMVDLRRGYVILDSGQKLAYSRLGSTDLAAVSEFWRLPTVCLLGNRGGSPFRSWTPQTVTWRASSLCHKPLYFENRQLERYGHSRGPFAQPVHSTVHFFTSLVLLPYNTAIWPANECQYSLGFFRPGDCAPWLKDPMPISLEGAKRQALIGTGTAFIP